MTFSTPPVPERILAIVVTRIGDTLLSTPALRALKAHWPEAELTVMAHPKRAEVLENLPFIDRLLTYRWHTPVRAKLAFRKNYDVAFVFSDEAPFVALGLALAKRAFAFAAPTYPAIPRLSVTPRSVSAHAVEDRLQLVALAGVRTDDFRLAYRVSDAEKDSARQWRRPVSNPLIALQPHSFPTKAHRDWPVRHFVSLVELIRSAYPDAAFMVTGDAAARGSAKILTERFGSAILDLTGKLSLRKTAALLSTADLYIGVDTGPTHLAGALGIPMVALYHAAYPGKNLAPMQHPRCRVIEHPASSLTNPKEADMADISPEAVWEAAKTLLSLKTV